MIICFYTCFPLILYGFIVLTMLLGTLLPLISSFGAFLCLFHVFDMIWIKDVLNGSKTIKMGQARNQNSKRKSWLVLEVVVTIGEELA